MQRIDAEFRDRFGRAPRVFRAPGRVNLIGEHTDYNDGFVMPVAIDFAATVAIAPRDDRVLRMYSPSYGETCEVDLALAPRPRRHWSDYIVGVAVALERAGMRVRGGDMLVHGSVPMGAGLSSSAALEVASGLALAASSGVAVDRVTLARACQAAENDFVGMRCGIMDQFISSCGEAGKALMLDCRSLTYALVPLPGDIKVMVVNSMVKHELASSAYNERRAQCEEGVRLLREFHPRVAALRDASEQMLAEVALPPVVSRRCRHVVRENARVTAAADAFSRGDLAMVGALMWTSHASLRDDYEVSCRELDVLVELAREAPGVLGSRMTGGGFGGCTVSLVDAAKADAFAAAMSRGYVAAGYTMPEIYACVPSRGAHEVTA
ncbi:MAG: galactokinase [Myxococcota bacterium]